jgi:putative FmdB family regulatory protein
MGAMPTYEYVCAGGHAFELVQRMSDKPVRKCPSCGARAERKLSGGAGLIFKGSGFYITDYGKDGKGPRKDASEAAPAATAAAAGSEPAPATKPKPDVPAAKPKGTSADSA